jgi:hypothetical protein
MVKVEIAGDPVPIEEWLGRNLTSALVSEVEVVWLSPTDTTGESRMVAVHLMTPSHVVRVS